MALAVVPEFRAVLVADVVDLRLLVGGRRLRRVMRAEDDALFQPLPGEQAGHGFPDVGQGLRLVLQRAAPKDAQGHGHHAVPVRELDAGRPRRRIHPGHGAETQGCAPVAFQRRDPPFLLRVVESAHVALNSPASAQFHAGRVFAFDSVGCRGDEILAVDLPKPSSVSVHHGHHAGVPHDVEPSRCFRLRFCSARRFGRRFPLRPSTRPSG